MIPVTDDPVDLANPILIDLSGGQQIDFSVPNYAKANVRAKLQALVYSLYTGETGQESAVKRTLRMEAVHELAEKLLGYQTDFEELT